MIGKKDFIQVVACIYWYRIYIERSKGITTLRIYQYGIFHYTMIETCFEMLKSSEHKKL